MPVTQTTEVKAQLLGVLRKISRLQAVEAVQKFERIKLLEGETIRGLIVERRR